jgi:hypothetical protein
MAKHKSTPRASRAKAGARRPHKPPAAIPAEFVTPSQALDYLAGPESSSLRSHAAGRRGETPLDMAQARLIKAHIAGRVNLVGRKGDVNDLDAVPDAFERIPNEFFLRRASYLATPSSRLPTGAANPQAENSGAT